MQKIKSNEDIFSKRPAAFVFVSPSKSSEAEISSKAAKTSALDFQNALTASGLALHQVFDKFLNCSTPSLLPHFCERVSCLFVLEEKKTYARSRVSYIFDTTGLALEECSMTRFTPCGRQGI